MTTQKTGLFSKAQVCFHLRYTTVFGERGDLAEYKEGGFGAPEALVMQDGVSAASSAKNPREALERSTFPG